MAEVSNNELSIELKDFRTSVEREFEHAAKDRRAIKDLADKHERVLFGNNGTPGVAELVRDNESEVARLHKRFDELIGIGKWFVTAVGGYIIVQLLSLI